MLIHITGNYPYHSLFSEMVRSINQQGVEQRIIVPLRNAEGEGINALEMPGVDLRYIDIYDNLDRLLYFRKMRRGYHKLLEIYPYWNASDTIIAHTVFSDGGLAYRLHKQFGNPYIACVRNSDINVFLKYKPYLKNTLLKILRTARQVVFLTPCYIKRVLDLFNESERKQMMNKTVSIPNGIHPFWFACTVTQKTYHIPLRVIFVGELLKNKNVLSILQALRITQSRGLAFHFDIVGDGKQRKQLERICIRLKIADRVTFHGWKKSKEELLSAYQGADLFIMPSLRETFGTVYLEAMTQGLPCIYTKSEGIDGWFRDGEIGKAVSPLDANQIADAIFAIQQDYAAMSARCIQRVQTFRWEAIARRYLSAAGISTTKVE